MSIGFHAPGFVSPSWAWLFGHRGGARRRRVAGGALVVSVACLAVAAAAWWSASEALAEQQRARAAAEHAVRTAVTPSAPAPALTAAERVRMNRVVRRLNMPWGPIFSSLEGQAMPTVAVLSLEPDVERGAVRVQTEGPSLDELLQHATRVQQAPYFGRTQLLRIDPQDARGTSEMSRLSFDLVLAR